MKWSVLQISGYIDNSIYSGIIVGYIQFKSGSRVEKHVCFVGTLE